MLGPVPFAVFECRDGRVVALVHDEDLAVAQHLIDEEIEQLGPGLGGFLAVAAELAYPVEHVAAEVVQPQVEGEEDVLLALEVVVESGLGRAEPVGDLAQRGLVVALLVEQLQGDVKDALARRAAWSAGTPRRGRPGSRLSGDGLLGLRHGRILLDNRQDNYLRSWYLS